MREAMRRLLPRQQLSPGLVVQASGSFPGHGRLSRLEPGTGRTVLGNAAPNRRTHLARERRRYSYMPPNAGLRSQGAEAWTDDQPWTPAFLRTVGPAPADRRIPLAFGHDETALAMTAIVGQLVAEHAAGQPPPIDPRRLRRERFAASEKAA
jgi:glycine/D-amino acid oxidase-like deaminating enzyme